MTNAAESEHNHTTAAAISSGVPILAIGSCAMTLCSPSRVPPVNRCIIGVSIIPGHTALMRIFDCACIVERRRFRQTDHAMFRSAVGSLSFDAFYSSPRRSVHDHAPAILQHERNLVLHAEKHAAQIDARDSVPLIFR